MVNDQLQNMAKFEVSTDKLALVTQIISRSFKIDLHLQI